MCDVCADVRAYKRGEVSLARVFEFVVVLVEALLEIFPNQVQQEYTAGQLPLHIALQHGLGASVRAVAAAHPAAMFVVDPVSGLLPIEQAVLNVGKDGSLENVDAVNALLRANPAFLE